jgi:hypothetical protein
MNLNESIRDWVFFRISDVFPDLAVVELVTMGETTELGPPFLAIYETGSSLHETAGVILPGVSDFEITCELHTVPTAEEEEGTPPETERAYRRQLYDILGDRGAIDWINRRNGWLVFDIRLSSPTTEANEGRRITRWVMSIIACPT